MPSKLGEKIFIYLMACFGIFGTIFFIWLQNAEESMVTEELRSQAAGIYHYIILTRQWISIHGGIYLKEREGLKLISPSGFTAAISSFAQDKKLPYSIKMAVQNAADPSHVPDAFEKEVIRRLKEDNAREVWKVESVQGGKRFRYGAPLIFENECSTCHHSLNPAYIKGCISISLPANAIYNEVKQNAMYYFIFIIGMMGFFLAIGWIMLKHFVLVPLNTLSKTSQMIQLGNLDVRIKLDASEEWETVGKSFNQMVTAIAEQQKKLESEVKKAISELEIAYQELKKTEEFKSDFFSNITHDLKTPITAIKGASELLEKRFQGHEALTYVDIVQRNAEKLSKMIKDLLDCSKIEAGRFELQKQRNDLAEVLEDAIFMVMPIAWKHKVDIQYDISHKSLIIYCDRGRMEQAITNLLSNAIKFSPAGKPIEIGLAREDNLAIITIRDHGPGIPKSDWGLVFQKFFRRPNESASEGLGLGLAITKGIIEAHNGAVWISDADEGIKFNITLPLVDFHTKPPKN